jgi:hypothetical protein
MPSRPFPSTSAHEFGLAACAVLLACSAAAAQPESACAGVSATSPDPGAPVLIVERLAGQALFAPPGAPRDLGGATGLCILLVKPDSPDPVVQGTSGESGRFELSPAAPGRYVLIAGRGGAHPIVVPLQVAASAPDAASRGLQLHMRMSEDSRTSHATTIGNLDLRAELLARLETDQAIRQELIDRGAQSIDPDVEARMAAIDAVNTAWVAAIVERHGWPRPALVGEDGSGAASTIVQHAGLDVQQRMLPLVEAAYREGAIAGQSYALLVDRVRFREGKPQIYGTQALPFDQWNGTTPTLAPIEDRENVDRRRAEVGLPPVAEYLELLERFYFPGGAPGPR